jgi:hypothetical protein
MVGTWTQRADKLLAFLKNLPAAGEGSPEKEFYRAVWDLCQELKQADGETDGGQFIAPSIMGG